MPVRKPAESSLLPSHLAGKSPADVEIVVDFFRRYDEALWEAVNSEDPYPPDLLSPQEVIPGLARLTDQIYESPVHPKFLLDGMFQHMKWHTLLGLMYPGGRAEAVVVFENVQGHPDYLLPVDVYGGRALIEVKTTAGAQWPRIKRAPLPPNREQTLSYLKMSDRDLGLLVYENRETLDLWFHILRRWME